MSDEERGGREGARKETGELARIRVGTHEVHPHLTPHPEVLEEEEMTPAGAYPVGKAMTGELVNDETPGGGAADGDITG